MYETSELCLIHLLLCVTKKGEIQTVVCKAADVLDPNSTWTEKGEKCLVAP